MKKKGLLIGILALLVTVIGVGIRFVVRHPNKLKDPVDIDSVVTYQEVDYSITKLETIDSYDGEEIRDGYEYIVITVNIVNDSDKKIDSNNDSWDLQGKNGEMTVNFVPVYSMEPYEIIEPGESGEIELVFEKKIGSIPTRLSYYKNSNDAKGPAFIYDME